jgi:hypothetical protein
MVFTDQVITQEKTRYISNAKIKIIFHLSWKVVADTCEISLKYIYIYIYIDNN